MNCFTSSNFQEHAFILRMRTKRHTKINHAPHVMLIEQGGDSYKAFSVHMYMIIDDGTVHSFSQVKNLVEMDSLMDWCGVPVHWDSS